MNNLSNFGAFRQYLSWPVTAFVDVGILMDSFDASKPAGSPNLRLGAKASRQGANAPHNAQEVRR